MTETQPKHVQVTKDGLAVKCERCGKSAAYHRGETLKQWMMKRVTFQDKHRACKGVE